jgi:hypothetical protein
VNNRTYIVKDRKAWNELVQETETNKEFVVSAEKEEYALLLRDTLLLNLCNKHSTCFGLTGPLLRKSHRLNIHAATKVSAVKVGYA